MPKQTATSQQHLFAKKQTITTEHFFSSNLLAYAKISSARNSNLRSTMSTMYCNSYFDYHGCPGQIVFRDEPVAFTLFPFSLFNYTVHTDPKAPPLQKPAPPKKGASKSKKKTRTLATELLVPECPPQGCVRKVYHLETIAYVIGWVEVCLLSIILVVDIIFICRDGNNDDWMNAHICILSIGGVLLLSCLLMMMGVYFGRKGRCLMMPWILLHAIGLIPFIPAGKRVVRLWFSTIISLSTICYIYCSADGNMLVCGLGAVPIHEQTMEQSRTMH